MLGFPDSDECPLDFSGSNAAWGAFPGPFLKPLAIPVEREGQERFIEHGHGTVMREKRISVNKTTHRIRFENETESEVTVVIEPKE